MLDLGSMEIQFAIDAVRQASLLVKQVETEMVSPALTKEDRSPVTVADFAAQALVGRLLWQAFPEDPLVGEESCQALKAPGNQEMLLRVTGFVSRFLPEATPERVCAWIDRGGSNSARRFWTLDPVDGTKGFLRGGQYAVALALVEDGLVQVGVLGCPNLRDGCIPDRTGSGALVVARRGSGTWVKPVTARAESLSENGFHPVHVSQQADPAEARLLRSFEAGHTNVAQVDELARRMGIHAEAIRMDSQAKYAILAAGGGEISIRLLSPDQPDYQERIWDQAAGSLVIEEAGGRVTDLAGKPFDFSTGRLLSANRGVVATNGHLHALTLRLLKEIGA